MLKLAILNAFCKFWKEIFLHHSLYFFAPMKGLQPSVQFMLLPSFWHKLHYVSSNSKS